MIQRAALGFLLLAAVGQVIPVRAQSPSPTTAPAPVPDASGFADVEARLHERYPAYVGFEVYEGTLFLNVDSLDSGLRLRLLRDLQRAHAPFLVILGARPGRIRFLQGVPTARAWRAADTAVGQVRGVTFVHHGARIERMVVGLQYPNQRDEAERTMQAAGVPPGTVLIITSAPVPLPTGPALAGPYRATLGVPATVRQGESMTITLNVHNSGQDVLKFEYGTCHLQVEIRRVPTGEVVRPVPLRQVCPSVAYVASIRPGEAQRLASREWMAETTDWRALAPGVYEVRATFGPIALAREQASSSVHPAAFILPAPVRFRVVSR